MALNQIKKFENLTFDISMTSLSTYIASRRRKNYRSFWYGSKI